MPGEQSALGRPRAIVEPAGYQESDDPFHALVRSGARDGEVRRLFAAILNAQDMPEQQRDEIWRAFLAAGNPHPRREGTADG